MAHVLVVDDKEDNRMVLARMLEFGGHAVDCAANGQEALVEATKCQPDLILMDLAMPGMDGWTATAQIKQRPELQHIPVIVVTGHVSSDEIGRAQEVGCQDIVSKPVDYYILVDKIRQHTTAAA
jgi:CheY-like chemotaxis protein